MTTLLLWLAVAIVVNSIWLGWVLAVFIRAMAARHEEQPR